MRRTYKLLDKSWNKQADYEFTSEVNKEYYLEGAEAFRIQALKALEIFSVLSNDEVFQHNGKAYVSLPDVIILIEGLYSEIASKPKKITTKTKKKK